MASMRNIRASDRLEFFQNKDSGFITRKTTVSSSLLNYLVLGTVAAIGTWLLVYFQTPIGCGVAVIVGMVMLSMSMQLNQARKTLFATEFMNALFSSIVAKGNQFCAITTLGGDIAYTDRSFQAFFPEFTQQKKRRIDDLCTLAKLDTATAAEWQKLVTHGQEGQVQVKLEDENGISRSLTLHIEPIARPNGFVLIRGR